MLIQIVSKGIFMLIQIVSRLECYLRNSRNNAIILGGKQRQTINVQDRGSQFEG
jgi:hypothetical protein